MGADNAWWMDVLENGPASRVRRATSTSTGSRSIPTLDAQGAAAGARRPLRRRARARRARARARAADAGAFAVRYFEHRFPIDPREYPRVARARAAPARTAARCRRRRRREFESLIAAFGRLPPRGRHRARQAVAERSRDKEVHKARLARLVREHPALAEAHRARACAPSTARPGEPASFDALARAARGAGVPARVLARRGGRDQLPALLRHQRPRGAAHGERGGVRGDAPVRARARGRRADRRAAHRSSGRAATIRRATSAGCRSATRSSRASTARPARERPRPLYVVLEKIVAPHEQLPESWPVHGTTGYRFANVVNGLFVDTGGAQRASTAPGARSSATRRSTSTRARYRGKRADHARARSPASSRCSRTRCCASRAPTAARATSPLNTLREALAEVVALLPGLPHLHRRRASRRRTGATSTGRSARRSAAAAPPTRASSTSCGRRCSRARRDGARPGAAQRSTARSRCASSSSPRR